MELAAMIEFSPCDPTENEVWQFATDTIKRAEYFMTNPKGELDI
jgi:hypothetical protein